jgi:hypothetical protein
VKPVDDPPDSPLGIVSTHDVRLPARLWLDLGLTSEHSRPDVFQTGGDSPMAEANLLVEAGSSLLGDRGLKDLLSSLYLASYGAENGMSMGYDFEGEIIPGTNEPLYTWEVFYWTPR